MVGNTQTGMHAHSNNGNHPSLASGNMSQPILHFPSRVLLCLASSCEEHFQGSGRPHKQKASSSPRQQSAGTPAETGALQTGEKCAQRFYAPVALLSLCTISFVFQKWRQDGCFNFSLNHFLTIRELSVLVFSIRSHQVKSSIVGFMSKPVR